MSKETPAPVQLTAEAFRQMISASTLRIRMRSPFFSTLMLYARFIADYGIPTAFTDGRDVHVNPEFMQKLPQRQADGVLLHETLHMALFHVLRVGTRDKRIWNLACFLSDALVETSTGYREIAGIAEGDMVRSRDGGFVRVNLPIKKSWSGHLVKVNVLSGDAIEGTSDHQVLVRSRKHAWHPIELTEPYWKELGELVPGSDYLHLAEPQATSAEMSLPFSQYLSGERREIIKSDIPLTQEAAWCLGRYVADGSAMGDNGIQWSIGNSKSWDAVRIMSWVESLGHTASSSRGASVTKVNFCSIAAVDLFADMVGRGAHNKQIPVLMYDADPLIVRSFLDGWLSGDGCKLSNGGHGGWTCSRTLALGLQRLALRCGEFWRISYQERIRRLPGADEETLQKGYAILTPSESERRGGTTRTMNGRVITSNNLRYKRRDDGLWLLVEDVTRRAYEGDVFTLSTDAGNYTVSNYTVKNCDTVVNGILRKQDYCELIAGAIWDEKLEDLCVEEIYELLMKQYEAEQKKMKDGGGAGAGQKGAPGGGSGKQPGQGKGGQSQSGEGDGKAKSGGTGSTSGDMKKFEESPCFGHSHDKDASADGGTMQDILRRMAEMESYWKNALHQAETIQRTHSQGNMPAGWDRIAKLIDVPQLDWRSHLWRYLVKTPTDFSGYDRRFIGRGLYLEDLQGESVRVYICIDTSGSIGDVELALFMSEVHGILGSYPHLKATLFYADAEIYGPYDVEKAKDIPPPKGGGGTSFIPFFDKVKELHQTEDTGVAVYLTDGYGCFPRPEDVGIPTLWVAIPGSLESEKFPFGEVARLLREG